jgi:hypothetical protein
MEKYSIDNVRGGSYTKIELSDLEKDKINQILNSINDRCYKCNTKGHFANECEKIQLLNDDEKLEEYIRIKLGQTMFPTPKYDECQKLCVDCETKRELLFNNKKDEYKKLCGNCKMNKILLLNDIEKKMICTNTKCNIFYKKWKSEGHLRFNFDAQEDVDDNKKIIELFNDLFKDKRCIVHSYKGIIFIQIVLSKNYSKYDYYYQYEPYKDHSEYVYYDFPYQVALDYIGSGTVDIIKDLIIKINNNVYTINSYCIRVELF